MLEERIKRLEGVVDDHEERLQEVERYLAVGEEKFKAIRQDIKELKDTIKSLTAWTQGTAITVGAGVIVAVISWLMAKGG